MMTNYPVGTIIRFRYRNRWDYGRIENAGSYALLQSTDIPVGTVVHQVVWKRDKAGGEQHMEQRRVFKMTEKDREAGYKAPPPPCGWDETTAEIAEKLAGEVLSGLLVTKHSDVAISNAMQKYGGGFVQALGLAASRADTDNLRRLKIAFPGLWKEYDCMVDEKSS